MLCCIDYSVYSENFQVNKPKSRIISIKSRNKKQHTGDTVFNSGPTAFKQFELRVEPTHWISTRFIWEKFDDN